MFEFFTDLKVDWMGWRKPLVMISVVLLIAGLISAASRQFTPGGTDAFNLGVDFQGGTVLTVKFRQKPAADDIRSALAANGITESVIQDSTDKPDEFLIKIPLLGENGAAATGATDSPAANANSNSAVSPPPAVSANSNTAVAALDPNSNANTNTAAPVPTGGTQVERGRQAVKSALDTFGPEAAGTVTLDSDPNTAYKIVGTDSVGPIAGEQLRDAAVIATLLGLVGMLLFIAYRYDWTYAAGAVVAVFHDVLVTLAFFSVFQWEVGLTVLAAMLTLVGFSVNDTIVIFDRIRENANNDRVGSLYDVTNRSINQTMSRTVVTNGLTFLSVLALVLFGGEVLRSFSLALFVGIIVGTYSTIAIASPIAIWWQSKLGKAEMKDVGAKEVTKEKIASASRRSVTRRPVTR
jgi:preprotein translocase subunit SecF